MNTITPFDDVGLSAPPAQRPRDELGQEDFLKLMISQFRNQDPFEPMDNGDFLGQLAQFGTVSGIEQLNSSFSGLSGSIQGEQVLQAANLVGRSVLAAHNTGYLAEGGDVSGAVELDASAASVRIEISDAAGQLVRAIDLGQQPPGLSRFTWDGRDLNGDRVPAGHYRIGATVSRGLENERAETLIEAQIDSVSLGRFGQGLSLNLSGGDTLSLAQVRRIQ